LPRTFYCFSLNFVYIINRIIHGCLEIPDLFLVLNMICHSFAALTREISCSTIEINLVFPRTMYYSLFIAYITVIDDWIYCMLLKSIVFSTHRARVFSKIGVGCVLAHTFSTHQDVFLQISMRCVLEHTKVCFH
jgi:hypothetical protein